MYRTELFIQSLWNWKKCATRVRRHHFANTIFAFFSYVLFLFYSTSIFVRHASSFDIFFTFVLNIFFFPLFRVSMHYIVLILKREMTYFYLITLKLKKAFNHFFFLHLFNICPWTRQASISGLSTFVLNFFLPFVLCIDTSLKKRWHFFACGRRLCISSSYPAKAFPVLSFRLWYPESGLWTVSTRRDILLSRDNEQAPPFAREDFCLTQTKIGKPACAPAREKYHGSSAN